ncbi:Xaa-Pro peptidase family protein [Bacillus sp. FJAT-47783]|uniref:M24 family metallopeptidase n=1 Tax=Bacillus sp. FJAT-47783 TaxID=2922712 RepID=UPI001FAE63C4|nr:Xaa-Pro peptidase family protein [Bacillus sp. FJAT-47783]
MNKINKVREQFDSLGIDGILITNRFNRRYMTGFTGTAGVVLISKTEAKFITDFRYIDQAKEQAENYEIVNNERDMTAAVVAQVKKMNIKKLGFETKSLTHEEYCHYSERLEAEMVPVGKIIEQLRMIKSEDEINILKEAAHIADQTFTHLLSYIRPGITELEVSNEIERYMRTLGATSSSFDTIVASGYRASLPHGVASPKVIEKGELVTLDFGAYYKGYCSDITRTIAVGEISEEWKEIYHIVLHAQEKAIQGIKPGVTGREIDELARGYLREKGYGQYFGTGTGHGIGLEIHEEPFLSTKSDVVLEPNMVITVEPGIYIPEKSGVRIEDDMIVTESGYEIITHSTKELIII